MKDLMKLKLNSEMIGCTPKCLEAVNTEITYLQKLDDEDEIIIKGEDSLKSEESSEDDDDMLSDISSVDSDKEFEIL